MEAVKITRPSSDIVIISLDDYEDYLRLKANEEYLMKLDKSYNQARNGQLITKTMDEIEELVDGK